MFFFIILYICLNILLAIKTRKYSDLNFSEEEANLENIAYNLEFLIIFKLFILNYLFYAISN